MMTQTTRFTERQVLILWALLVRKEATGFQCEIKPEPTKTDREWLKKTGLIETSTDKLSRRILLTATEKGWGWASDNLSHELPRFSKAGATILQAWLTRLEVYLKTADVSLADVLSPQHQSGHARIEQQELGVRTVDSDLSRRIREAYLAATGNRLNARARLAAIRAELEDVDRRKLDEALKAMQREQIASLYPLDNKAEITNADRHAAIYFGDEPRHILWLSR